MKQSRVNMEYPCSDVFQTRKNTTLLRGPTARGVTLISLIVLAALLQPAAAQSVEEEEIDQSSLSYTSEDLRDPAKARLLLQRIDRAALKVCGGMDGISVPIQRAIEHSACRHESVARAVASFHNSDLTRMMILFDPWVGPTTQERSQ